MTITLTINGIEKKIDIAPGATLLEVLRHEGYVGVKSGCGSGDCGACAVLLNGRAVNSCLTLAVRADGASITTVEGLADGRNLHPIQKAFLDTGAVQCGYCTPGMLMSALDLLSRIPNPSDEEIREAISGNLCRCTGYVKQVEAIRAGAKAMRSERHD